MDNKSKSGVDLGRLDAAISSSRLKLEPYRANRQHAVRQYAGRHYGDSASPERVTLNYISLYVEIVGRALVSKEPRVMLSTFDRESRATVAAMEAWCNRQFEKIGLSDSLRRVGVDALFSVGVAKVALSTPGDSAASGYQLKAGEPFVCEVDLDDLVLDMKARTYSECTYIGHRYSAPVEMVRNSKMFSREARLQVNAGDEHYVNETGDDRIAGVGTSAAGDDEDFEDMADLWEVYIPRTRRVLTLYRGGNAGCVCLRDARWLGPECGPYHFLALAVVPGNLMAKSPIMDLIDGHEGLNEVWNKLVRQTLRQKSNLLVQSGADEDGLRVVTSQDGEAIRVDSPDKFKEVSHGGPNQANFQMALSMMDRLSYMAGNLDAMGGLAPQTRTLGQDQLLQASASAGVLDKQASMVAFTSQVVKSLCWYYWHHPEKVMEVDYSVPGVPEVGTTRRVTPEQRKRGDWERLDIRVDPHSLQHQTPQQRAATLQGVMTNLILPLTPMLQEQGIGVDANALLTRIGRYTDQPDLQDILSIQEPTQISGASEGPGKSPVSSRTYNRVSSSEPDPQGDIQSQAADMGKAQAAGGGGVMNQAGG